MAASHADSPTTGPDVPGGIITGAITLVQIKISICERKKAEHLLA
jgi:hypothetical protein